jgi:hypothetical protein
MILTSRKGSTWRAICPTACPATAFALGWSSVRAVRVMPRVVRRSAFPTVKAVHCAESNGEDSPLLAFIPPQLSQPVDKPPSGPQWVHEIKLDGFRMAARIDNDRVQLLIRAGLDWTGKLSKAQSRSLRM